MDNKKERVTHVKIGQHANISIEMIDDTVVMAEEAITVLKQKQSELESPLARARMEVEETEKLLNEYKKELDVISEQYENYEEKILKKKGIISLMNHLKTGKKDATFYDQLSNTVHKAKARRPKTDLQQIAVAVLKTTKRFLKAKDLVEVMFKDERFSHILNPLAFNKQQKFRIADRLLISANLIPKGLRIKKLKSKDDFIGLPEWFDSKGEILPEHITDFMNYESPIKMKVA